MHHLFSSGDHDHCSDHLSAVAGRAIRTHRRRLNDRSKSLYADCSHLSPFRLRSDRQVLVLATISTSIVAIAIGYPEQDRKTSKFLHFSSSQVLL